LQTVELALRKGAGHAVAEPFARHPRADAAGVRPVVEAVVESVVEAAARRAGAGAVEIRW
jgi:hypothetical protein